MPNLTGGLAQFTLASCGPFITIITNMGGGVDFITGAPVIRIITKAGKISGVETPEQMFEAETVVVAAGPTVQERGDSIWKLKE